MTRIVCHDVGGGENLDFQPKRVIIAGFTGRQRAAVEAHIAELAAMGVPVPSATPVFFIVDHSLLTSANIIHVEGTDTSGEVEPVIVFDDEGVQWLTVGSDHTDRQIERTSIALSKQACAKVIGREAIRVDRVANWDAIELTSWVDDQKEPYQVGFLAQILSLASLLGDLQKTGVSLQAGDVLFLGTVPVSGGELRPADIFRAELRHPDEGWRVELQYAIDSPA